MIIFTDGIILLRKNKEMFLNVNHLISAAFHMMITYMLNTFTFLSTLISM